MISEPIAITAVNEDFLIHVHEENELLSDIIRISKCYSRNDLIVFKLLLDQGDYFIDAGANIGWHTLFASKVVGEEGKVISFEPYSKNYELLVSNIEVNNFKNVVAEKYALSNKNEEQYISCSPSNYGDNIISDNPTNSEIINCITFDSYIEKNLIDSSKIKLIKMDIQGYEYYALQGMKKLIDEYQPNIILEYSPTHLKLCKSSVFDIMSFIDRYNYVVYNISTDRSLPPERILTPISYFDLLQYAYQILSNPDNSRDNTDAIDVLLTSKPL